MLLYVLFKFNDNDSWTVVKNICYSQPTTIIKLTKNKVVNTC